MKIIHTKKIGVWGFGRVGKAVANFLHSHGYIVSVLDKKFTQDAKNRLQKNNILFYTNTEKNIFFDQNDYILPSPGIDIRPHYQEYKKKWLTELDLFQAFFEKNIIAITGSVGKTTITHILSQLLEKLNLSIGTGGNIGNACFNLLEKKYGHALLEVSSFQLEYCTAFAPNLAIWTNFTPNHLDRHTTEQDYFDAKYNILARQNNTQQALVPFDLYDQIKKRNPKSQLYFFAAYKPNNFNQLSSQDTLFYLDNNHIIKYQNSIHTPLFLIDQLPPITFTQNWLIICVSLHILNQPLDQFAHFAQTISLPKHRLELVKGLSKHNIYFFNDSKSTTPTSTLAAVEKFKGKPLILFLGGLSKGINRAPLIEQLQNKVKYIYCFGAEAHQLHSLCMQYGITSDHFATLDDAFKQYIQNLEPGDHVLFSPAGSSFDLFKNYEDRGTYFKKLVCNYCTGNGKKQ